MSADPYRYFRIEARELCDDLARGVLDLESASPSDAVARVMRAAHTLKGAARVVRQAAVAEVAHALEETLGPYRDGAHRPPPEVMARLLAHVDEIEAGIAAIPADPSAGPPPAAAPSGPPAVVSAAPASMDAPVVVRTEAAEIDDLLEAIGEAQSHLTPLLHGVAGLDRIRRGLDLLRAQLDAPPTEDPADTRDRVRAMATGLAADLTAVDHSLTRTVERGDRELRQIRATAEQLRLVRAGSVFSALHRAARDAATQIGCRIAFTGTGADTRLDPQVLSTVYGALLHVVRNAVAHGIETVAQRQAAGKPDEGQVAVAVKRRGTRVVFSCRDDGRGIDLDAVRRAAAGAGIDTDRLTPDEVTALVLRGGISTAGAVTELAGRGVGMDAVRDAAERLGGEVAVASVPGRGTTVDVVVPLSLLAVECLIVDAGGRLAALPLDAVHQCLRLTDTEATAETVRFGAHTVPFMTLATELDHRPTPPPAVAMIVSAPTGTAAVGVDRVVDTATVVVRALPPLATAGPVVGGLCIADDGNPRLVLDPAGLVAAASHHRGAAPQAAGTPPPPVLIVDDSLTTRMLERSILESAGYEVDVAASGEEGLLKARENRYGLFLVDVEMPGMDGFTFIEHTRADPTLQHIPSILVSSRASTADRERGREAGAAMHVNKGAFDQNELLDHIGRLVGVP